MKYSYFASNLGMAAVFVLIFASPAKAQRGSFAQGTQTFRFVLNNLDLEPLPNISALEEVPERTTLILFGEVPDIEHLGNLQAFVRAGGAILIATDWATPGFIEENFGVRVTGNFLKVAAGSEAAYRGLVDCPYIKELGSGGRDIFQGLKRVAGNRPSFLRTSDSHLPIVATAPADEIVDGQSGKPLPWTALLWPRPFAAAGTIDEGRILILADHSIFINDMMLQTDNDNFDFTYACLAWLTEEGKRNRVLFLDNGIPVTDFKVPMRSMPGLPVPPVDFINRLAVTLGNENLFNRLILSQLTMPQVVAAVAVSLTIVCGTIGLYRLSKAGYRTETTAPLVLTGSRREAATAPVLTLRQQGMLAANNLWEAAHNLTQQFFASIGYIQDDWASDKGQSGIAPVLADAATNRTHRARTLNRRLQELWLLANDRRPRRVTRRQFKQLLVDITNLKRGIDNKMIVLDRPGNIS